jgi:hypothetical protein
MFAVFFYLHLLFLKIILAMKQYKTAFLPSVLYEQEIWFLTLGEEPVP